MRVAAVADLHCRVNNPEQIAEIFEGVNDQADVLVLAGDLTDSGLPEEMEVLLGVLETISLPKVAVLGNHDHDSDQYEKLCEMLRSSGAWVLDGTAIEIGDVGFVGTKGFAGGFGDLFIQPFGERALKTFIQESLDEAVRLENALTKLQECKYRVGVLHYAPVRETLEGEPLELYAFLGSSRLANALDRHGVNVIFHGHAHHGSPEGRTLGMIPVFNVSRFVRTNHSLPPYCIFDLSKHEKEAQPSRLLQ